MEAHENQTAEHSQATPELALYVGWVNEEVNSGRMTSARSFELNNLFKNAVESLIIVALEELYGNRRELE